MRRNNFSNVASFKSASFKRRSIPLVDDYIAMNIRENVLSNHGRRNEFFKLPSGQISLDFHPFS